MLQPRIASTSKRLCTSARAYSTTAALQAVVVDTLKPSKTSSTRDNANGQVAPQPQSRQLSPKIAAARAAGLKRYVPRTPGLRHLVRPLNEHIWKGRPLFALTFPKKGHAKGGRNHTGHITVRHRGGGHNRRLRIVDFMRTDGGAQMVERIEHDPNRSAHIALLRNLQTGKQSYILAAEGMRAGDTVQSYRSGLPKELTEGSSGQIDMGIVASKTAYRGNCLKLGMIPVGTPIYNIANAAGKEATIARSAGCHGIIIGKGEDTVQKEMIKAMEAAGTTTPGGVATMDVTSLTREQLAKFEKAAQYVTVRLSSGEIRLIDKEAIATIGVASNANFKYQQLGKAGRKRWLGIRPTVRGVAMNANDHPHGGGRGKSKGGRNPVSAWGKPTKSGYKTRPKHKVNKLIVQERPRNQGKRRRGYA